MFSLWTRRTRVGDWVIMPEYRGMARPTGENMSKIYLAARQDGSVRYATTVSVTDQ